MSPAEPILGADIETLVASDQVRLLYSKSAFSYLASVINALLFAIVVGHRVARTVLVGWVAAFVAVALLRTMLRSAFRSRRRGPSETARWARAFAVTTGLNGAIWGAAAIVLFLPDLGAQMLLMLIICGMSAGATALSASYPPAFFAFVLAEMTPLVVRLAMQGDRMHGVLATLVVVFGISMTLLMRTSSRAVREAARLRFSLAALNETLESHVVERTAQLRAALSGRDEFISIASHELKTPLTSLKLQLQLLEKDARNEGLEAQGKLPERLRIVDRQAARLTVLVNRLLDISRLDVDGFELEPRDVDLVSLVRRVGVDLEAELRRHGCELTVHVGEPLHGNWDPVHLEQIVTNLVSNAAKFGAGKPIVVALAADDDGGARLTVTDQGIGIAPADVERIFGKFERAVPAAGYGGFGLGLFVVQQLVHAMHGTVRVASTPGEGSEFTVRLPR
jgi:signal transduction histidine kinase